MQRLPAKPQSAVPAPASTNNCSVDKANYQGSGQNPWHVWLEELPGHADKSRRRGTRAQNEDNFYWGCRRLRVNGIWYWRNHFQLKSVNKETNKAVEERAYSTNDWNAYDWLCQPPTDWRPNFWGHYPETAAFLETVPSRYSLYKPHLEEVDKLICMYLQGAFKGKPAMYVIQWLTKTAVSYGEAIQLILMDCYNHRRVTHHEHVWIIIQAPVMKASYGRELQKLYDTCKLHIGTIELSGHLDLGTFLTIMMELKMDEVIRPRWIEHRNDSQTTPLYSELLKFLDVQGQHFESVISEWKPLWPRISPTQRQLRNLKSVWCAELEWTTH